jgi:parvulin-like peptidyl-prolyl isomerase
MKRLLSLSIFALLSSSIAWSQTDREIVRVNGTPIRQSEVLTRLWKQHGPQILEEMVDELLLRQAAQAKKIKAQATEIEKRLSQLRQQFGDSKILEKQLEQSASSVDQLKEEFAEQILREQLVIQEKHLSVTEEEIKRTFENRREELATPPAVHLRHILVQTEAGAKELLGKINGGADFAQIARENSMATAGRLNGGDYGFVSKGMLPAEVEVIVFAMKPKELRLLSTAKGFHILEVLEIRGSRLAEYPKVKDDLKNILLQEKIRQALPEVIKDLRLRANIQPQGV